MGRVASSTIWNDSDLKSAIKNGTLGLPPPAPLPNDNEPMPYHIIADDAFTLSKTVIFNYRRSQA